MAKRTPTKKQLEKRKLKKQYNEQIRRIKRNYSDIELRGGIFSKTVEEIIRPVKEPKESTIRRLKSITKNDLYRLATTKTGESGWKIRLEREKVTALKSSITKHKTKLAKEKYPNYEQYNKKEKEQAREQAYEEWREELDRKYKQWLEDVNNTEYTEPEDPYKWVTEPEPEPEPEPELQYEEPELTYEEPESYEEPDTDYGWAEDIAEPDNYRDTMLDTIQDIFNRNQNYDMMNTIRQEFEDMIRDMDDEELKNWLDENQQDFIDAITEVEKYLPSNIYAGTKGYSKATELINNGVTPLENFYNTSTNHVQARSTIGRKYFEEKRKLSEDDEEDKIVRETFIDRLTGEMISAHLEQTYDGWSWFDDEYNLPLSVNIAKGLRYLAVSEIKENEDYF